jgi:hypothetical protein
MTGGVPGGHSENAAEILARIFGGGPSVGLGEWRFFVPAGASGLVWWKRRNSLEKVVSTDAGLRRRCLPQAAVKVQVYRM